MDARQLTYFLTVVEEQQFTSAAHACGISQSGLSAGIRALERSLGARLFDRSTRKVRLTSAGEALVPHARAVLAAQSAAQYAVARASERVEGLLRVGTEQCLGVVEVAPLVEQMSHAHPGVTIEFFQQGTHDLIAMLRAGRLDLALVSHPDDIEGVKRTVLGARRRVFLASEPMAPPGEVIGSWKELASYPFVDLQESWAMRTQNDRMFEQGGVDRQVRFVVNDVHALLDLVQRGLAAAVVPSHIADKPQAIGLVTRELPDDTPAWQVHLATGVSLSPPARTLLDLVPRASR
ncbi:LysR substrate-binding domain-containing protein [Dactylosporangium fulvum]|uniref:LysR family transcriptional regulator n=1 Tax=Dactylosporangium fulvum TaxID=53359 RepID=A0ABY5W991_9ACTN|nr:LysR family transcriptional regulator [Dactylosporangium fulvum]UWP86648.1 LysR family transcriptional regulator [Dactylosporangium fulvum]